MIEIGAARAEWHIEDLSRITLVFFVVIGVVIVMVAVAMPGPVLGHQTCGPNAPLIFAIDCRKYPLQQTLLCHATTLFVVLLLGESYYTQSCTFSKAML